MEESSKILGPMYEKICADGAAAVDMLDLGPTPDILDIGTGSGNFAIFLAQQGYQVLTGEPSTDESRYARQQWEPSAAKMGVRNRIRFEHFDAGALPFEDNRFDGVFLFGVLHHVPEDARSNVLAEAIRVSGKDGAVILFEPLPETLEKIWVNDPQPPLAADPSVYIQDLIVHESRLKGSLMDIFIYRAA